jgi:predicted homoserine dehydrogenase-like protein
MIIELSADEVAALRVVLISPHNVAHLIINSDGVLTDEEVEHRRDRLAGQLKQIMDKTYQTTEEGGR